MNKQYFQYLCKTKKTALIFIFLMYFAFCASSFITRTPDIYCFTDALWYGFVLSIFLAFALPVILFSFVHLRRSRDVFLALPLTRKEILITNLVFAFVCIYGCMFLTFVILYLFQGRNWFGFTEFIETLIFSAFMIFSLLLIHTVLFLLANNTFDGIVMIASYTCMPLLIYIVENIFYDTIVAGRPSVNNDLSVYFSPLVMFYQNYRGLTDASASSYYGFSWIYIIITVIFTLISIILLKKEFIERKSERSEQLSDGRFAYPFVINIYAFALLLSMAFSVLNVGNTASDIPYFFIYYLLILFAYVIAEFVYHRSVTLKISTIIKYIAAVVITFLIGFIGLKTEGFGQARNYAFPAEGSVSYSYQVLLKSDLTSASIETDDTDKVYVDFYLDFDVINQNGYKDAIEIMEENRSKAIDYYYDHDESFLEDGYLQIENSIRESSRGYYDYFFMNVDRHSYDAVPMTIDELKVISKYTKVTVAKYNSSKTYSLDEYLEMEELD